jgi:DNA polymerase III epsilon subunit-like protein
MFLDLETGGFSPTKNAICELAFLVFDTETNEIVSRSCLKIKPYIRDFSTKELASYKDDAMAINGHNLDDLRKNGLDVKNVFDIFDKVIQKFNIVFFGGHNLESFDLKFIDNIYKIYLKKDFKFSQAICTMKMAKKRLKLKSYSLESLCKHFNYTPESYHNAMSDTQSSYEIFQLLRNIQILPEHTK